VTDSSGKQIALGISDPNALTELLEAAVRRVMETSNSVSNPVRSDTVASAVGRYLDAVRHRVQAQTLHGYRQALSWYVRTFGERDVASVTSDEVEKSAASEPAWSDSHRANLLWLCQSVMRSAGRKEWTVRRPAKESRGAECVITAEVHERILVETSGDFNRLLHALWLTGARPGELANLTAEAVDWTSGTATLKQHKTRHKGKSRILYFSPEALKLLAEQRAKYTTGLLFRSTGRGVNAALKGSRFTGQKIVRRMLRVSAKIGKDVSAYGYRHSYATRALESGIPDTDVAALLGHANPSMIHMHYSHISCNGRRLTGVAAKLDTPAA
jgi:site-specific recombinase XerD